MTAPAPLWQGEETLVPAALRGYRSWNAQGGVLASTGVSHRWEEPQAAARCLLGNVIGGEPDCDCDLCVENQHLAPVRDCTCGIYGWYDPADSRLVKGDVFGVVEVTGRAVMASHGFRAEKARIVALAIEQPKRDPTLTLGSIWTDRQPASANDLHTVARWAKTQGIPVFSSRSALLDAYPPQDVSSLVEHECSPECQAHREHGSSKDSLSAYMRQMSLYTYPSSITYSTNANSLTTASSTYATKDEPKPRKCAVSAWLHVAVMALALFGLLVGVSALVHNFSPWRLIGPVINAGLFAFLGYHLWTRHPRKKKSRNRNSSLWTDDAEHDDE